jgi:restriction modification system DNA specificity domain protein
VRGRGIKLEDCLTPQRKSKIKAGEGASVGRYKFFTSSPIQDKYYARADYHQPALVFGTGGSASVHYCADPFSTSTDCVVMYGKNDANLEVIYQYLQMNIHVLEEGFRGAGLKHISKSYILNICVNLPEEQEQKRLVEIANKLDNIIHLHERQLKNLDTLVKARFIEMFCQAQNREWHIVTIGDIATDARTGPFGSALLHSEFVDDGIFVLGIDNAVENKFSYNRMRYITEEKYHKLKRYTVYADDVIITIMGTVGRTAVIPKNMPAAINTKHLACITPNKEKINSYFLACAFRMHPGIISQLKKQCKGAIMDGLNLTIIKAINFQLPPLDLQDDFADFYFRAESLKSSIRQSLSELTTLKKSLLQEYFG